MNRILFLQLGHAHVVELLLQNGANPNIKHDDGTPIHPAAQNGDFLMSMFLLQQKNVKNRIFEKKRLFLSLFIKSVHSILQSD